MQIRALSRRRKLYADQLLCVCATSLPFRIEAVYVCVS